MEVDAFLRAHREHDVREVHPELVFLRLNGDEPLAGEKVAVVKDGAREFVAGCSSERDFARLISG